MSCDEISGIGRGNPGRTLNCTAVPLLIRRVAATTLAPAPDGLRPMRGQADLVTTLTSQTLDGNLSVPNVRDEAARREFVELVRGRFASQSTGVEDQALIEIANFLLDFQQFRNQALGRN